MQKSPNNLNQNFTQMLIDKRLQKPEHYFCTKWLRGIRGHPEFNIIYYYSELRVYCFIYF